MATSAEALQNLQNYQASMKNPTALIGDANAALGVGAAQQQVQGLRGAITNTTHLLDQVAPGVMGRTQNSLVTSAQANRQIQNEQAPISSTLSKQNTDYANANADYSDLEKQAEARANAELQAQQQQVSYLQSLYGNIYQQEKDAADRAAQDRAFAESQRQFNAQMAASAAARAGSAGASPSFGGGGGASAPAAAAAPDYFSLIQSLRQQPGGVSKWNWGALANEFRNRGIDISHGSAADKALNAYFNG